MLIHLRQLRQSDAADSLWSVFVFTTWQRNIWKCTVSKHYAGSHLILHLLFVCQRERRAIGRSLRWVGGPALIRVLLSGSQLWNEAGGWAAAESLTMSAPVSPERVSIAMLISPLVGRDCPCQGGRTCEEGPAGQEGALSPLQGAFKLCERNDARDSRSYRCCGEHDREGNLRENSVSVMETDGLVLSHCYCWGSRLKRALRMRYLIQLAVHVCWARCPRQWPSIQSSWRWQPLRAADSSMTLRGIPCISLHWQTLGMEWRMYGDMSACEIWLPPSDKAVDPVSVCVCVHVSVGKGIMDVYQGKEECNRPCFVTLIKPLTIYYTQNINGTLGRKGWSDESFPAFPKRHFKYQPKNKDLHFNFHRTEI